MNLVDADTLAILPLEAMIMTIDMEIGPITSPAGLNLYVTKGVASDVPLHTILKGSVPYVPYMILATLIPSPLPGLAPRPPDPVIGPRP